MNFFEEEFTFKSENRTNLESLRQETFGIKLRIGNQPIVKNMYKLLQISNQEIPKEVQLHYSQKDIYIIVHCICAIRTDGNGSVKQLEYIAEALDSKAQTIDLLPCTKFIDKFKAEVTVEGSLASSGEVSAILPELLTQSLSSNIITLTGDTQLQLSSNASFVGKFVFGSKFPLVQSGGNASSICEWVLAPEKGGNPMFGDQLLIQTISVPKNTKKISYKMQGKALLSHKGIFIEKEHRIETKTYSVEVELL